MSTNDDVDNWTTKHINDCVALHIVHLHKQFHWMHVVSHLPCTLHLHSHLAQVLSAFHTSICMVIHGALSLTRPLPSSFTISSCPSPSYSPIPSCFSELDNPIVMASLRYSAAERSEDTLNSFTSPTDPGCPQVFVVCFFLHEKG